MKNENPRHGGNVAGAVNIFAQHKENSAPSLKFQSRADTRNTFASTRLPGFTDNLTLADAAVLYAKNGVPVFPLHGVRNGRCLCGGCCGQAAGRHPLVPNSYRAATINLPQVRKWWRQFPHSNIGIATGAPSGLTVLTAQCDLGMEPLDWHIAQRGPLPRGPIARTPDGLAVFFKYSGEISHVVSDGIEVHAAASFVVAPPSRTVSGHQHEWCRNAA